MVLSGAVNRNVREFRTLFADEFAVTDAGALDLERIERLILVETFHANRLAELGPLLERPGIEVVVFDHHRPEGALPPFVAETNFIVSDDGSLVTLMLRIIADREIEVTPLEATVFALGIHEDTGSLTFPTTTVRDVEALAFCMRRGANQQVVEHFLHNPLSPEQRDLLMRVLEKARAVEAGGLDVLVAALSGDVYVEGVSLVVHKAMDVANSDAMVLLVEMEERIFVTARSRVAALDVAQQETLVANQRAVIPGLTGQMEQFIIGLGILVGRPPEAINVRPGTLDDIVLPPVAPGLPSELLERRPDIRAAEQNLIAANANIGVAKAAYFPQISLSGFLGGQSTQLASLFTGPHTAWSFVPQVTQPIFTAGRLKSTVRLAEAQQQAALIQYEKSIQTAFSEVSNALIAHQRLRESRVQQEALVTALSERKRLAYVRYEGGVDTLLNALDADRDLFQAELSLSQVRLNELLSVVQLYKALGGGWQS